MSAADTLLEYIERREQVAAQRERAAVVAWLRSVGGTLNVWADQIESGEHLRADYE